MRIKYLWPLGVVLIGLFSTSCEDDPNDLDYLKDASVGGTGGSSATAGSGGAAGAATAAGAGGSAAGAAGH
jgi:hypothetical protein